VPRDLDPDERALWRRVTADMRKADAELVEPPAEVLSAVVRVATPPVPSLSKRPRSGPDTLDGRWDRQLSGGLVRPDRVVDLHELPLAAAHRRAVDAVEGAAAAGERIVLLVTGKAPRPGTSRIDAPLRGIIRASIVDWLAASGAASRIAAIRPAHIRHGGAGALYVVLRRPVSPAPAAARPRRSR